jgi:hypothetical protein
MRRALSLGLSVVCTLLLAATVARAAEDWRIAPTPEWVDPIEAPADAAVPTQDVSSGTYYLLVDHQVSVGSGPTRLYTHWARKVLSTSGLENASELRMSFDPSFQRLTIHHVRVLRGGRNVASFQRADVKTIHDESDLDQRIYNGTLTALVFVKDVRPGDVVDYAYTLEGDNPIMKDHFAGRLPLGYTVPVSRIRHRIVWSRARTLRYKGHQTSLAPRILEHGAQRVYEWEQREVPPLIDEGDAPGWDDAWPWVQVTDFESWGEVARWAAGLFAIPSRAPAAIQRLAAHWPGPAGDEPRARAAVRMVQDEIRYLGIEIGPNSHQPHRPEQVLAQRFGDCKDKALLLSVLLHELGAEATPALVNTRRGHGLDASLPTPFAFDHAIVSARIGGRTLWIDATHSLQGGALTSFEPPPFERALLVSPETEGLIPIPVPTAEQPTTVVEETYVLPAADEPARLHVQTTYSGRDADEMRATLESTSPAERARNYLNFYAHRDEGVRALHAPQVADTREANVLTTTEDYELPAFWRGGKQRFNAWPVSDRLHRPETRLRTHPLRVEHPVHVRYRLGLESKLLPSEVPTDVDIAGPAMRFSLRSERSPKGLFVTYDYRSLADSVAAASVRTHLQKIGDIAGNLDYAVDRSSLSALGPRRLRAAESFDADVWWAIALISVGTVVTIGTLNGLARRRQHRRLVAFVRVDRFASGAAPETAWRVAGAAELARTLAALRCACGAACADVQRSECRYDGRLLTVIANSCGQCGAAETLYFEITPPPASDPT